MKVLAKIFTLLLAISLWSIQGILAQDTHFSQFYASPLNLNPALAGVNDGTYRVAGIYREQYNSFTTPFITYSASFDIKLLQNLLKSDIFGLGGLFLGDRSGDGVLALTTAALCASYHKALDKEHKYFLGIGIQGSYTQKSVNWNQLSFPDQFDNGINDFNLADPSHEPVVRNVVRYFDLDAGILGQQWIKKDAIGLFEGFSIYHLSSPKESFYANDGTRLQNRFTVHAGAYIKLTKHFYLTPNFLFQYQNKALEPNIGTAVEYHLDTKHSPFILSLGVWDRIQDAFIVSAGMEYYHLRASFAYDITTSSLTTASQNRSAFEIALIYTGIFKSREMQAPRLVPCPRM